jgi:hypothetical protein
MIYFDSVGSWIDVVNKMIYPSFETNKPDFDCGIHIDEIDDEWFDNLDDRDLIILKNFNLI